jgi:hypothetical protein
MQSIKLFRLSAQWQNSSMLETLMNRRTRNSPHINTSDWDISLRRPRPLKNDDEKKSHHHNGTRAGLYHILLEEQARRISSCSAMTVINDAQCIHHFCSRDQLTAARYAITCALASFVLTSIAIRHAARETIRGWRNLLTRTFADDVLCSRETTRGTSWPL